MDMYRIQVGKEIHFVHADNPTHAKVLAGYRHKLEKHDWISRMEVSDMIKQKYIKVLGKQ